MGRLSYGVEIIAMAGSRWRNDVSSGFKQFVIAVDSYAPMSHLW